MFCNPHRMHCILCGLKKIPSLNKFICETTHLVNVYETMLLANMFGECMYIQSSSLSLCRALMFTLGGGEMLNVNHSKCYDKASSSTFRLDNSYEGDIVASQISVVENRRRVSSFLDQVPCLTFVWRLLFKTKDLGCADCWWGVQFSEKILIWFECFVEGRYVSRGAITQDIEMGSNEAI